MIFRCFKRGSHDFVTRWSSLVQGEEGGSIMKKVVKLELRSVRPRSIRKELRAKGMVLGTLYGNGVDSTPVVVDEKTIRRLLRNHGENTLLELVTETGSLNGIIHVVEKDTITGALNHVQFLAVGLDNIVDAPVEIVLVGDAAGTRVGGVLVQTLFKVKVSAKPAELPENIEVDVSGLNIGDSLTVQDIKKVTTYEIHAQPSTHICSVKSPIQEIEPEEEEH
jgi:large subunit ribosomal protein L25